MKITSLFFLVFITLVSCQEPSPRKPTFQSNQLKIQASVERNKKINQSQQRLIAEAIKKDSLLNYQSSAYGYWFAIEKKRQRFPNQKLVMK